MSNDNILDYFPEEHGPYEGEMIIIKSFYFETPARLYAARLKEAGIPSFVSNTSINIPFGNGGITLHIRKEDQQKATHIIHLMDKRDLVKEDSADEESFHDADHDDIAYQRAIHEKKGSGYWVIALIIVLLLAAMVAQFVFNKPLMDWWQ